MPTPHSAQSNFLGDMHLGIILFIALREVATPIGAQSAPRLVGVIRKTIHIVVAQLSILKKYILKI